MIEESLLKSNYAGKDGFSWWIGQVASKSSWDTNSRVGLKDTWGSRCKVRIVGSHTFDPTILPDDDLPWAQVIMDPTVGNGIGGLGSTIDLKGGESCFGFFLDGNDGQQPVVVGLFYRSETGTLLDAELVSKEGGSRFKPFSGHPKRNIPSTQRFGRDSKPVGVDLLTPNTVGGVGIGTSNPQGDVIVGVDPTRPPAASNYAFEQMCDITIEDVNGCENNVIGKITRIIQNFIATINGLERYANVYINPVLNVISNIDREVKNIVGDVSTVIRSIVNTLRSSIFKCLISLFKRIIGFGPNSNPIIKTPLLEALSKLMDKIYCILEKIIDKVLPFLEALFNKMIGNVVDTTICAVEQIVAAILSEVMDAIDVVLSPIISGISWLTGGLSNIFNMLNQASSLAREIYNFLSCSSLSCKTPSTWSSRFGPSQKESDNWTRMVDSINVFSGMRNSYVDSISAIGDLAMFSGSGSFNGCDNNKLTQSTIYPTPIGVRRNVCIPPIVEIVGDGVGATATPVVDTSGQIFQILITSKGIGYTTRPFVSIIDNSGYGSGASAVAVLNSSGGLDDILITNSGAGYCVGSVPLTGGLMATYSVSVLSSIISEGKSCIFAVDTANVLDGTTLYWNVVNGNTTTLDFVSTLGTLTINSDTGTFALDIASDLVVDPSENFQVEIRTISDTGPVVATSSVVTIDDTSPTYKVTSSTASVDEGSIINFNVTTGNVPDGTPLYYSISGTNITDNDFTDNTLTGTFNINSNSSTFTKTPSSDNITEGVESFTISIRTGSITGPVVVSSSIFTINDTWLSTGCVKNLYITRPGYGYTPGDTISDGKNTYPVVLSPNGSLIGYKLTNSTICNFQTIPNITINTNTGVGAVILPSMSLSTASSVSVASKLSSKLSSKNSQTQTQIIKVINCV